MPYGVSQQLVRLGAPVPALSHPPTLPLSGRGESNHAKACLLNVRRGTRIVWDILYPRNAALTTIGDALGVTHHHINYSCRIGRGFGTTLT